MSVSVELDEQTAAVVRQLAATENRAPSEVIHDALAAYASLRRRALPKGAGKYRSGHRDTSEKVEEILRDAVEEWRWP